MRMFGKLTANTVLLGGRKSTSPPHSKNPQVEKFKGQFPHRTKKTSLYSENNFAIWFLLEIPMRGFPFQMKSFEKCRMPKNNTNSCFQRISFEKEILSRESKAGNISQTPCPSRINKTRLYWPRRQIGEPSL